MDYKKFLNTVRGPRFMLFVSLLFAYIVLVDPFLEYSGITFPLEILEANIVSGIHGLVGVENFVFENIIFYPDLDLGVIVGPLCVGLRELFLFSMVVLILGNPRGRFRTFGMFLGVIFLENIIRLSLLYPMATSMGFENMLLSHDAIWQYGQALFLLAMLALWFWRFGKPVAEEGR